MKNWKTKLRFLYSEKQNSHRITLLGTEMDLYQFLVYFGNSLISTIFAIWCFILWLLSVLSSSVICGFLFARVGVYVATRLIFHLFADLCSFGWETREKRGVSLIWHTLLWTFWDMRNAVIFSTKVLEFDYVVKRIKSLS